MNTHDKFELPEPKYPAAKADTDTPNAIPNLYTAGQVIAAIEADRKTYNSIGEGTIQQLHDVLLYLQNETMKLEAAYGSNFKKEATEKARSATEKMKEAVYAIKNIDRKRRGEPTAAEISDVIREITGCPDIKNGEDSLVVALGILFHRCATTQSSEPDYKQLFEQMCERCDALDAKLAEYSEREPVGYIMPTAIKQLKAGGNAIVGGVSQGCDVPIYTAPQPAEPCVSSVSDKTACGSENGDCDSQPDEPVKIYVETRECHECGHVGINDAHGSKAACNSCGWTGYTPNVDRCPGCDQAGTMTAACPTCGGRYGLLAEKNITWISASAAQPAEPVSKIDWSNELSSWSDEDFIRIFHEHPDLANRLRKMLAEPMKAPSNDLAHEIWAAAQTAPGEGVEDAVERIAALLARYGH